VRKGASTNPLSSALRASRPRLTQPAVFHLQSPNSGTPHHRSSLMMLLGIIIGTCMPTGILDLSRDGIIAVKEDKGR
jgi:hypothetical protein